MIRWYRLRYWRRRRRESRQQVLIELGRVGVETVFDLRPRLQLRARPTYVGAVNGALLIAEPLSQHVGGRYALRQRVGGDPRRRGQPTALGRRLRFVRIPQMRRRP